MFLAETRANEIKKDYCVEAERKKLVPYVKAMCIKRSYGKDGVFETYSNNEVYKLRPNGMREFVRKLTPEEVLEHARKVEELLKGYKSSFPTINK